VKEFKFYIAGIRYHKFKTVCDELEEGMKVDLVPEPHNKFDKYAVAVKCKEVMLGYVPAKKGPAKEIFKLISAGIKLNASISSLNPDFEPWNALELEVKEDGDG
jgi:hypothetical protein